MESGICPRCVNRPPEPGSSRCRKCLDEKNESARKKPREEKGRRNSTQAQGQNSGKHARKSTTGPGRTNRNARKANGITARSCTRNARVWDSASTAGMRPTKARPGVKGTWKFCVSPADAPLPGKRPSEIRKRANSRTSTNEGASGCRACSRQNERIPKPQRRPNLIPGHTSTNHSSNTLNEPLLDGHKQTEQGIFQSIYPTRGIPAWPSYRQSFLKCIVGIQARVPGTIDAEQLGTGFIFLADNVQPADQGPSFPSHQ